MLYLHVEAGHDALDGVVADVLAYEGVDIAVGEVNVERGQGGWIDVLDLHAHLSACKLFAQDGGLLQGVYGAVGVDAALEAVACVGAQAVAACALADPGGMEIGALKHNVLCGVVGAAALASEDACYAHGVFGVADAQVVLAKGVLLAVEGHKLGAFGLCADHDLVAFHHVGVEAMHGLAVGHHYVVGDVDNVVDGAQTDDVELVLQPLGAFLHLAACNAQAGVAFAGVCVLYLHVDGQLLVVNGKG